VIIAEGEATGHQHRIFGTVRLYRDDALASEIPSGLYVGHLRVEVSPFDALSDYLDRWGAAHLSAQPADRESGEEGVRMAYAAAGLAAPRRIVWCGGPLEIAKLLATASPPLAAT
jgi:hypothetical protein